MGAAPADFAATADLRRAHRALVMADLVDSVRLIGTDPDGVIALWRTFVESLRRELLPARGGRMVKSLGDGFLLDFERVPDAAAVAVALHARLAAAGVLRATSEPSSW